MMNYSDVTAATLRYLYSSPSYIVDAIEAACLFGDDIHSGEEYVDDILKTAEEIGVSKEEIAKEIVRRLQSPTPFSTYMKHAKGVIR